MTERHDTVPICAQPAPAVGAARAPSVRVQRAPAVAVHVVLAASACLAGTMASGANGAGFGTRAAVFGRDALAAAKWAAEPVIPVAGAPVPEVMHPEQCAGLQPPLRTSPAATEITCDTVRRAARTRLGGRYGP